MNESAPSMNEPSDQRVYDLAEELWDLDLEQQRQRLNGLSDAGLATRVAEMLSARDQVDGFLENPLAAPPSEPIFDPGAWDSATGDGSEDAESIDGYRILRVLGEGGMGRVYLAEQSEPVERRVAIKVVLSGPTTVAARERFSAERRALARLNHPHVAHIFEAGTTDSGRPFFAMEWVDGEPIQRFCEDRRLTIEDRLVLFRQVCDGLQHAHQKQIVHRDLKPSNVLVTEEGAGAVPKIIDFGIAKAMGDPLTDSTLTRGLAVGTPSHMSPEALEGTGGELDTRADIYSLGILLCELLTGTHPFVGWSVFDRHQQRHDEPRRPSRLYAGLPDERRGRVAAGMGSRPEILERRLRGELDWIVLRAMAPDRERRYSSAAELAEDIGRYLRHEPVAAMPPSFGYVAGKWLRRHRFTAFLAASILISLVLGVVGTSLGWAEARRARQSALAEAAAASEARDEAEEVGRFLAGLFQASAPWGHQSLPAPEGPETDDWEQLTARQLLERGAARIASGELADRPRIRARLSETLGEVYRQLGVYDQAQSFLDAAIDLRLQQYGAADPALEEPYFRLGQLANRRGRYDKAREYFEASLRLHDQREVEDPLGRSWILDELGRIHRSRGRFEEAEAMLSESLELRLSVVEVEDRPVAQALNNLANVYFQTGRAAEAEGLYARCLEIHTREVGRRHPRVVQALNNLAVSQASQGRFEDAAPAFEEALALREAMLGGDHPDVAESLNNLAVLYTDLDRPGEVEALHRRALKIRRQALGSEHPTTAWSEDNLASHLESQGHFEAAEIHHRRALVIRLAVLEPDHPALARSRYRLGRLLARTERWVEAEGYLADAWRVRRRLDGADERRVDTREVYTEVLKRLGKSIAMED